MLSWYHSCAECSACPVVPHPEWRGIVSLVILVSSNSLSEKGTVGEEFCKNGRSQVSRPRSCVCSLPTWHLSFCWLGGGWKQAGKPKGLEFSCYCTTSTCSFVLIQSLSLEILGAPPKHYSPPPPSKQEIIGGDRGAWTLLRLVFSPPHYCCKLWRWTALSSFHPSWCSDDKA